VLVGKFLAIETKNYFTHGNKLHLVLLLSIFLSMPLKMGKKLARRLHDDVEPRNPTNHLLQVWWSNKSFDQDDDDDAKK